MKKKLIRSLGIFFLFLSLFNWSFPSWGQTENKMTLESALNEISRKFKVKFAYEHAIVQGKTIMGAFEVKKSLEETLKKILYPNDLLFLYVSEGSYTIVKRDVSRRSSSELTGAKVNLDPEQQGVFVSGVVVDENGTSLPGATIKSTTSNVSITTDASGRFSRFFPDGTLAVSVSYIGYEAQIIKLSTPTKSLNVVLTAGTGNQLQEVNVVSNGYQTLPKERSTGSQSTIGAEDIKKVKVNNIIQIMESMVPGVKVSVGAGDNSFLYKNSQIGINGGTRTVGQNDYNITIRGNGTIRAERFPLIVVDGAIYELDLSTLNPNDIENITFLKDAAAASIWGTRAANGVMVINTKKGTLNQAPSVSFSTNASVSNSPNLSYLRLMNASQAINFEQELVNKGIIATPSSTVVTGSAIAGATDLLFQRKAGTISQADFDNKIAILSARDSKQQVADYLLQPATSQQYNFSVSGGGNANKYFYSASYSKERPYAVGNSGSRLTVALNNTFTLFKKATLTTSVKAAFLDLNNNAYGLTTLYNPSSLTFMPYDQIVDENGNRIQRSGRYYKGWTNSLTSRGYKSWDINALDEIDNADNTQKDNNYAASLNLNVPLFEGLSATAFYSTERAFSNSRRFNNDKTFFYRDLVNYYTPVPSTGNAVNSIGLVDGGGVLNIINTNTNNYTLRGQLNYERSFADKHQLTAIAGSEIRQTMLGQGISTMYGYNNDTGIARPVNFFTPYPTVAGFSSTLGGAPTQADKTRRYLSYYGNFGYTYSGRYTLTGSVRYDDYNNFGLDRKFRATPLWSTGLKWDIHKENFMSTALWLTKLSFRATYGVNGNISTTTYPFTGISLNPADPTTGLPSANITAPANPELRWEKTYVTNLGLDFGFFKNKLFGSIDIYRKNGRDLLYDLPISGTYGVTTLFRNTTNIDGRGVDLALGGIAFTNKDWEITGRLNYSYNTNKAQDERLTPTSSFFGNPAYGPVISGYPTDKLLVYRFAGLSSTGMTQVYDENSKVIAPNQNITSVDALVYAGRSQAPHFGALNTSIRFREFTLMAIATYQFGSVFLRPTISSYPSSRLGTLYDLNVDVDRRWRNPGDELTTNVPGVAGVFATQSLLRYQQSDINVLKGDYIRLRELSLSYQIPVAKITNAVKVASFAFAVRNLGLLWTANKEGFDPDFVGSLNNSSLGLPATVSYNLSLNVNF